MERAGQSYLCQHGEELGPIKASIAYKLKISNAMGGRMPQHASREIVLKISATAGGGEAEDKLMSMGFESVK